MELSTTIQEGREEIMMKINNSKVVPLGRTSLEQNVFYFYKGSIVPLVIVVVSRMIYLTLFLESIAATGKKVAVLVVLVVPFFTQENQGAAGVTTALALALVLLEPEVGLEVVVARYLLVKQQQTELAADGAEAVDVVDVVVVGGSIKPLFSNNLITDRLGRLSALLFYFSKNVTLSSRLRSCKKWDFGIFGPIKSS